MKDTKFIVKKIRASAQQPNIWNSTYLTYVIRGNLHRINRAGNACQMRRGYARVY